MALQWLFLLTGLLTGHGHAAIWGEDDRREAYEYPPESAARRASRSVAMVVPWSRLTSTATGVKLNFATFGEESLAVGEPLCARERFQSQPASVYRVSTGFLAAADIVVTAGHVIDSSEACLDRAVVFGVEWNPQTKAIRPIPPDNVFACHSIIKTELQQNPLIDYTVLKLDRPALRPPLKLRRTGKIVDGATVTMVGHPYALPIKITGGGLMRNNSPTTHFITFLDSYPGNSGSPIIDSATGLVEGMLVEGETGDTALEGDWPAGCWYSKVYCDPKLPFTGNCDDFDGVGSKAMRTTVFAKWIAGETAR